METECLYKTKFNIFPIKLKDSTSTDTVNFGVTDSLFQNKSIQINTRNPSFDNYAFKYSSGNSNTDFIKAIKKRYLKLVDGMKKGNKIVNEIETVKIIQKNYEGSFRKSTQKRKSDVSTSTAPYTQRNNTSCPKKLVIYDKPEKDCTIVKKLECNESFRINIKQRVFSARDIRKVIFIQKNFRGYEQREVTQRLQRLKAEECSNELFCLLIEKNYLKAMKRICFYKILNEYPFPFETIGNEVSFNDKLKLGMFDKLYKIKNNEGHKKIYKKNRAKSVYSYIKDKKVFESL